MHQSRLLRSEILYFVSAQTEFRWCLNAGCSSGALYYGVNEDKPLIRCGECKFKMCFKHQQQWHEGKTCQEYDFDTSQERKTERFISAHTKRCPGANCGAPTEKNNGCFHMTCRCPDKSTSFVAAINISQVQSVLIIGAGNVVPIGQT